VPVGAGVVSASFLNAKPATGGNGVEPRRGGMLRALFTSASDTVADTVVRWRHVLRGVDLLTAVLYVLSDREEAQHRALCGPISSPPRLRGRGRSSTLRASLSTVSGWRYLFASLRTPPWVCVEGRRAEI
jgi:hypothetical protein